MLASLRLTVADFRSRSLTGFSHSTRVPGRFFSVEFARYYLCPIASLSTTPVGRGFVMLITVDVGNSHTVIGIYEGERLRNHWRISTVRRSHHRRARRAAQHAARRRWPGGRLKPEGVAIACVVPPLNQVMEQLAERYFHCTPLMVGPGIKTGMPILYENPKEVGADRIVNAVAAFERYACATIVVDFGTATTFDYVTGKGEYAGGAIAPGLGVSMNALIEHAAKLYRVELVRPREAVGRTTVGSIQSGLIFGYTALVDGLVDAHHEGARRKGARHRDRRPRRLDRARERDD